MAEDDAYANLVLPGLLRRQRIVGRDAAFATELTYGTLRLQGLYDAVLATVVDRPLVAVEPAVLSILRLGSHQLLGMRVPDHAAVAATVGLARATVGTGAGGLVNAVLRRVAEHDIEAWREAVVPDDSHGDGALAVRYSHPEWVVRALRQALLGHGRDAGELQALLAADNEPADVSLLARPGLVEPSELLADGGRPGRWSPYAVTMAAGSPGGLRAIRSARARVQDEGSQLVALALAAADLGVPDPAPALTRPAAGASLDVQPAATDTSRGAEAAGGDSRRGAPDHPRAEPRRERWLDLCAGPGGKSALLSALAVQRGHSGVSIEVSEHRAELARQAVAGAEAGWQVQQGDARDAGELEPAAYDRVLVDVPCTGLGALRRRPEARWRRRPADLATLAHLQRDLLASAIAAARPGGVVAYVTCSPHLAETRAVVEDAQRRAEREGTPVELLKARQAMSEGAGREIEELTPGPTVQLWPHLHGTDGMFLALLRRR